MNDAIVWLTIFVLSVFVGIEVISKVSSTLHTPLMSGANAIHGSSCSARSWSPAHRQGPALIVGLIAIVLAADQHGRRLRGHRPDAADVHAQEAQGRARQTDGGATVIPVWAQFVYLVCAVGFILALKGLSGPKTARTGNLIGAAAAVVACALPFTYLDDMKTRPADPGRDRGRHRRRRVRRPHGADDPDAADGGPVQRRRRRRGRPGRGPRADEIMPLGHDRLVRPRRDRVHDRRRLGVVRRLGRHVRQAAGADDLPRRWSSRACRSPSAASSSRWSPSSACSSLGPEMWIGVVLALLGLVFGVLLVLPVGGADVPIVISLLNAFTGLTVAAGGYVLSTPCCWSPARSSAPPARSSPC